MQYQQRVMEIGGKSIVELKSIIRNLDSSANQGTLVRKVRKGKGSIRTYKKAKWMLESFIFPQLGPRPITQISASDLLVELKKIEMKGLNETARRTKQRCGKVFRHAIGLGHAVRDLTPDLRGLFEAPQADHSFRFSTSLIAVFSSARSAYIR